MKTVTIQGEEYAVYADVSDGDRFYNAAISAEATAWRAADDDDKARGLVTGTRFIDAQNWKGQKTGGEAQENAFPRTELTRSDGSAVDPDTIPHEVETTTIMLAGWFMEGTAAQNAANVASGTRRLKAGSVEIEYFRAFRAFPGAASGGVPLPPFFLDLLGSWLAGMGVSNSGSRSFGTCGKTAFRRNPDVVYPY